MENGIKTKIKRSGIKSKFMLKIIKITINIAIFLILLSTFIYYNASTLNKLGNKKIMQLTNYFNVASPNSYIGTYQFDDRFFVGELEFTKYKFVGDNVFYDGESKMSYHYGNIPFVNGMYGNNGDYLFYNEAESQQGLYEAQSYNKIGRRIMKFYLPSIEYANYINDLSMLNNINEDKNVELSLSFDKEYTIDEVNSMLPNNITLNWLWVDTYNEKRIEYMRSHEETIDNDTIKKSSPNVILNEYDVYGIKTINSSGEKIKNPESIFIDTICNERLVDEENTSVYEELFEKLNKDNRTINKSDIKIIGVVVSGDVVSLNQLSGKKFIKASTFGAITNKY